MSDLDIIKGIEKIFSAELCELDEVTWKSYGCTLNQNSEITGLGLWGCKIKNLNCIISPLKALTNLTELRLQENQL